MQDLWICLICGVVGCGRYANGHAYGHFTTTSHTYSMQLGGNCVWDYAGDNYVHRLVQNKADGKLVEVDEQGNRFHEKKMDQISLEVLDDCIFQMYIKGCHFLSIVFLFQPSFWFLLTV